MEYTTIICDLRKSRSLPNREAVQRKLIETIKEANVLYASTLVSPFLITIGDEWQGLLVQPGDYQKVLDFFRARLTGLSFYAGVGVGEVSIHDFELTVNQLDGPSFYKARAALTLAKRLKCALVYAH